MEVKKIFQAGLIIMALCASIGLASSSLLKGEFEKANKLYSEGKYKQALENYQMIDRLLLGRKSPSLYYNMGNSYYKLEDYAHALLYYLKAEKLTPGDKELEENIKLCRRKLGLRETSGFFEKVAKIRVEVWVIGLAVVFWLIILVMVSTLDIAYKTAIGIPLFLLFGLLFVGTLLSYFWHGTERYLVLEEAKVFSGPSEKEGQIAILEPGVVLKKLSQMESWVKVKAPENITGWVKRDALGDI